MTICELCRTSIQAAPAVTAPGRAARMLLSRAGPCRQLAWRCHAPPQGPSRSESPTTPQSARPRKFQWLQQGEASKVAPPPPTKQQETFSAHCSKVPHHSLQQLVPCAPRSADGQLSLTKMQNTSPPCKYHNCARRLLFTRKHGICANSIVCSVIVQPSSTRRLLPCLLPCRPSSSWAVAISR